VLGWPPDGQADSDVAPGDRDRNDCRTRHPNRTRDAHSAAGDPDRRHRGDLDRNDADRDDPERRTPRTPRAGRVGFPPFGLFSLLLGVEKAAALDLRSFGDGLSDRVLVIDNTDALPAGDGHSTLD